MATLNSVLAKTGAKVYHIKRQKDSVVPAIVYIEVSKHAVGTLTHATNAEISRYQITCFGKSASQASALSEAVSGYLDYNMTDFPACLPLDTHIERYDEDSGIFYVITEYYIFHNA